MKFKPCFKKIKARNKKIEPCFSKRDGVRRVREDINWDKTRKIVFKNSVKLPKNAEKCIKRG